MKRFVAILLLLCLLLGLLPLVTQASAAANLTPTDSGTFTEQSVDGTETYDYEYYVFPADLFVYWDPSGTAGVVVKHADELKDGAYDINQYWIASRRVTTPSNAAPVSSYWQLLPYDGELSDAILQAIIRNTFGGVFTQTLRGVAYPSGEEARAARTYTAQAILDIGYYLYTVANPDYADLSLFERASLGSSPSDLLNDMRVYHTAVNAGLGNKRVEPSYITADYSELLSVWSDLEAEGTASVWGLSVAAFDDLLKNECASGSNRPSDDVLARAVWLYNMGVIGWTRGSSWNDANYRDILRNEAEQNAQMREEAEGDLGPFPAQGTFYERARWCARASILFENATSEYSEIEWVGKDAVVAAGEEELGDDWQLKRQYLLSLYDVRNYTLSDPEAGFDLQGSHTRPVDALTTTTAVREYAALLDASVLTSKEAHMLAWKYKVQAAVGLASGTLAAGDGVPQDMLDYFIEMGLRGSDTTNYYGTVDYPRTPHIGSYVDPRYYFYVVQCYQEFAFYGDVLIQNMGYAVTAQASAYSFRTENIQALKTLYEAASWLDDPAIWEYWDHIEEGQEHSLRSVYEYLMSVNAFEISTPSVGEGAFRYFFDTENKFTLSGNIQTGVNLSTSYIPLHTNVYDPYTYTSLVDNAWLLNFHTKFGYNRKALYVDTTADAALSYVRTGTRGTLRVCTLGDLIESAGDVVLYLDDNLYNVDALAELTDKAYDRTINSEEDTASFVESLQNIFDVSMVNIAKTAEVATYSERVQRKFSKEDEDGKWHSFFFSTEECEPYLSPDNLWEDGVATGESSTAYSPLSSFAVLSAIYSDTRLFSQLNTYASRNNPVFISSPTMPYVEEASSTERNSIFNYLLLQNMEAQMTLDYATNLDMTSPVYMDIYGNILTESGLVVVPAAANATLWESAWSPYNAAFLSTYGDAYTLPYDENATAVNKTLEKVLSPVGTEWCLAAVKVIDGSLDLSHLSIADKDTLATLSEVFAYDLAAGRIVLETKWLPIVTEVLRGAPIEHINKTFEGLELSHGKQLSALATASKLETLVDALASAGENTTLSIPNPAYMDGLEYVVFFAFKILILFILVIWMLTVYVDTAGGHLGIKTAGKCIGAVALVISLILGVPAAFDISYYQSNKMLLQDETELLMMLNLEKAESGQEIGVTKVSTPDTTTELYLKLADVEIPWYDLFPKIIMSSTVDNLEELYAEYEAQHPLSFADNVTAINDAIYISTDQLFDSAYITFSPTFKTLSLVSTGDTPASYYTPYYYFLDQLVYSVNAWSEDQNIYSYTTKVQRGGRLKTLGYVESFFTSDYFMQDGMDYFGLYTLYNVKAPAQYPYIKDYSNAAEVLDATRNSQWCNTTLGAASTEERIELMNDYVRKWVADHRGLIGKVTDETFLRCMALSCAMEHNRIFGTQRADSLEISHVSNEDLMRLSMADEATVMRGSAMNYARFVYTIGGSPAVYAAALLLIVNFICSWLKPLATIAVFLITCVSIFVFKLLLRKGNNSVYGYVCTILLMCGINVLGAGMLKLTMLIPATGLTPTVCILLQILVQCLHMVALLWVVSISLRDWRDMGFEKYNIHFDRVFHKREHSVEVSTPKSNNGWDYYNALVERQRRRHRTL